MDVTELPETQNFRDLFVFGSVTEKERNGRIPKEVVIDVGVVEKGRKK